MKAERPLISVIIPVYNGEEYLKEAVESIYVQDYPNLEVIIVNDGSIDGTDGVVRVLQKKHPDIVYLFQENSGVCVACNNALQKTKGEYVMRLDGDDCLPPGYISTLFDALQSSGPKIGYAYCDAHYFGSKKGAMTAGAFSLARLIVENYIHVSALVKADLPRTLGYYNPNMQFGYEDWDFWLLLAEYGYRGIYCPSTFLYYRQHQKSRNTMEEASHRRTIQQVYMNHPQLYNKVINRWRIFVWKVKRKINALTSYPNAH